ncbi:MAG: alpha/beta fold hydrolase [Phycisphaerae bacterium]|nr:alpha/beta fold hydrolase [Gemmatimonadaceae bacterium]
MRAILNGVELAYDDTGSGTPVVFIHGFPHDRALWSEQVSALSTHVRCIAPDLRGFGESSTDGPYSVDQYADDLAQLLNHLSIDRAVVCGLSMGGYIAMAMWRRHRERVLALVLCDTKAGADNDEGRRKRDDLIATATQEGSAKVAELQISGMVGKTTREKRPDIVDRARAMMARQSVEGIVGALTALRDRPDSTATLGTVTVPTLVVVGDEDALTPVAEAEGIVKALAPEARAKLEIVQGSGHASCMERPAAVTHVLADFLATLSVHS